MLLQESVCEFRTRESYETIVIIAVGDTVWPFSLISPVFLLAVCGMASKAIWTGDVDRDRPWLVGIPDFYQYGTVLYPFHAEGF